MKKVILLKIIFLIIVVNIKRLDAAEDSLIVMPFIRFYSSTDFITDQTKQDFELSGLVIKKTFNDKISALLIPAIARKSTFIEPASFGDAGLNNDPLDVFIVAAAGIIKDLGYGFGFTFGMFVSPFYYLEEYYHPYRFIEKPLDYRIMINNFSEMGIMFNKSFMNNALRLNLGYIAGVGYLNSELFNSGLNDNHNAGVTRFMLSFFPFWNEESILKELSLTLNLRATARTSARSSYNLLLGYKFAGLSASLEYLGSYSTNRIYIVDAASFAIHYQICEYLIPLLRYDYMDNNGELENYMVTGISSKWYNGVLQVALTGSYKKNPYASRASMKRVLISTQLYF